MTSKGTHVNNAYKLLLKFKMDIYFSALVIKSFYLKRSISLLPSGVPCVVSITLS